VFRQASAGLIWSQQFYYYHVRDWLAGDPAQPAPPAHRAHPNQDWPHLFARDILSMPDKWEFPWFAVWDTAFHMIPHGDLDPRSPRTNCCGSCASGTSTPTGRHRLTSSTSPT
jgi:hypothetical protein